MYWADKILKYIKEYKRKNTKEIIKNKKYDIDVEADHLKDIYIEVLRENYDLLNDDSLKQGLLA